MNRSLHHVIRYCAVFVLTGVVHAAAPPVVADTAALYSHTMPLQFQGRGGLVQLRLPKEVYLHARSRTLDDVRVFDTQGRNVPFALTLPGAQRDSRRHTTPAKVFALGADAKMTAGTVAIRTNPDGTLLSVESRAGKPATGAALGGLLVDMGAGTGNAAPFNALVFSAPPDVLNYSAHIAIEASDDMQAWHTMGQGRVDWLSNSTSDTLANNRIPFEPHSMRYVRLRWLEGEPRLFGAVAAEREVADATAETPDTLLVAPQAGVFPGDLVYPIGRAVPVRSIGLRLPDTGMVVPSEVGRYIELPAARGAATKPASQWQFVPMLRTTFYKITQDGSVRTPADLSITPISVDRLVLRPLTPLASQPALQIGWLPATLIFAARDAGPYTLAVGLEDARSAQAPLADVAPGYRPQELRKLAMASTGPVVAGQTVAQGPSDATRAGLSATARTAVLWGVLLLGVLVLAVLSWRMVRQLPAARVRDESAGIEKHHGDRESTPKV
jgi:hypothetical protein